MLIAGGLLQCAYLNYFHVSFSNPLGCNSLFMTPTLWYQIGTTHHSKLNAFVRLSMYFSPPPPKKKSSWRLPWNEYRIWKSIVGSCWIICFLLGLPASFLVLHLQKKVDRSFTPVVLVVIPSSLPVVGVFGGWGLPWPNYQSPIAFLTSDGQEEDKLGREESTFTGFVFFSALSSILQTALVNSLYFLLFI